MLRVASAVLALAPLGGCAVLDALLHPTEPLPTVDGPEDLGLAERLDGWVVWAEGDARTLGWLELPGRASGRVELGRDALALLGADPWNRLLFLDEEAGRVRLRCVAPRGGTATTLIELPPPVRAARLAPGGGWLCWYAPDGGGRGRLWVLELALDDPRLDSFAVADLGWSPRLEWLTPGEQLVYELPGRFRSPSEVRVLDLRTLEERCLARGELRLAGVDPRSGRALVLQGDPQRGGRRLVRLDMSCELRGDVVALPGLLFGVLGVSPTGLVVYDALPTTGTVQELWGWGLTWPRASWSLKVADPATGAFLTLVPHFGQLHAGDLPRPVATLRAAAAPEGG